jgi:hypothetical protein
MFGRPIAAKATPETSRLPIFTDLHDSRSSFASFDRLLGSAFGLLCRVLQYVIAHRLGPPPRLSLPYRSVYFLRVALHALCDFGRNGPDQVVLTGERRSVDDGISPKMVR